MCHEIFNEALVAGEIDQNDFDLIAAQYESLSTLMNKLIRSEKDSSQYAARLLRDAVRDV